ncbi:MAG: substrate-binding domain-containing protein [Acidobacteriota bacterium]
MRLKAPPLLLCCALLLVVWPGVPSSGEEASFKIVTHADVAEDSLPAKQLSKIFLKKIKRWEDDSSITVFDLEAESEVRDAFSRSVHRKSISAIKSYWQRMIFSGRDVAPVELDSEAKMLEQIAATAGSVGYVSATAELPDGVKVLEVEAK